MAPLSTIVHSIQADTRRFTDPYDPAHIKSYHKPLHCSYIATRWRPKEAWSLQDIISQLQIGLMYLTRTPPPPSRLKTLSSCPPTPSAAPSPPPSSDLATAAGFGLLVPPTVDKAEPAAPTYSKEKGRSGRKHK